MTPGLETALIIVGFILGFALGYDVRALISYRRRLSYRRRRDATWHRL
jgi:hypothetical protein